MIDGLVLSFTVNPTTQVSKFPLASITVTVIGREPTPLTTLPCAGFCVTLNEPLAVQLSLDCALTSSRTSGTAAEQFSLVLAVCAGIRLQAITGLVVSDVTVTLSVAVAIRFPLSTTTSAKLAFDAPHAAKTL